MADRLAEIRARAAAATEGTWGTYYDGAVYYLGANLRLTSAGSTCSRQIGAIADGDDKTQAFHDAMFIGRARTDVPWLLAELDRERAARIEAEAKLAIREGQVDRLSNELADMETGLGLNEEAVTA